MLLEQSKNPVVSRNYQMEQKAVWHPTDKQLLQLAFYFAGATRIWSVCRRHKCNNPLWTV